MVVSKDNNNKRRRKETETPTNPAAQSAALASAAAAVESSPEMPKRTKVQAQRKFAQGQSAPSTSYSALAAAAAAAAGGPSTSAESREPPIDILPNLRPKTHDFLTFLCFRGTSTLPPHLDYLNQGNSKETENTSTAAATNAQKKNNKQAQNLKQKKGKRGRPKGSVKKNNTAKVTLAEESISAAISTTENNASKEVHQVEEKSVATIDKIYEKPTIIPGAVRKRAEIVSEGNRRGRRSATSVDKSNNDKNSPDAKRRSNRTSTKEGKSMIELETDEDDEYYSAHDVASKAADEGAEEQQRQDANEQQQLPTTKSDLKASAAVVAKRFSVERKSETPSKDSDTGKSIGKRGRPASASSTAAQKMTTTSNDAAINTSNTAEKTKAPIKRVRQRAESPIFIPSPESSGRMTRQRAFFEPVKVIPQPENGDDVDNNEDDDDENIKQNDLKAYNEPETTSNKVSIKQKVVESNVKESNEVKQNQNISNKETKANFSIYAKDAKTSLENGDNIGKSKSNLNVFDFSSDDEQPLSKAIKLKKGKSASPKKQSAANTSRGRKPAGAPKKVTEKIDVVETLPVEEQKMDTLIIQKPETEDLDDNIVDNNVKAKPKRGRVAQKKKADDSLNSELDITPPSPKKAASSTAANSTNARLNRGKGVGKEKIEKSEKDVKNRSPSQPVRNQRPSRKTKEAAAIYMGIIGQKLQMADDEEDDLSLDSFPEIPNVKEMEKMENEIKKNATQTHPATAAKSVKSSPVRKPSPKPAAAAPTQTPPPPPTTTSERSEAAVVIVDKPAPRRGRPPKQSKAAPPLPPKREIEGMLVKKGALAKIAATNAESNKAQAKSEHSKPDSAAGGGDVDDEDFLINEELNETKRKLEKSFSDSDDEPLAIKVNVKGSDKETTPLESPKAESVQDKPVPPTITTSQLTMLPLTTKHTPSPVLPTLQPLTSTPIATTISTSQPILVQGSSLNATYTTAATLMSFSSQLSTPPTAPPSSGAFKVGEKKSPVPTSKILNVPATYALPGASGPSSMAIGAGTFNKTSPYLPQASPHYHTPTYVRPPPTPTHQFSASTVKSPTTTTQSPLKYQTPPTTYPPPIEAYQCPKINPNFLTPKFDRTTLPRSNNFHSPSPVKFDPTSRPVISSLQTSPAVSITPVAGPSFGKTPTTTVCLSLSNVTPSTSAAAAAATSITSTVGATATAAVPSTSNVTNVATNSNSDPLKDEIGSILAASLMPSKEESGKVFGIASVSLAQSSGPDNTKCTLGKCGSIHKPVLGPVVPTEVYFGDQLSSKERRKAKVNMTHEQIQKWLIECSSNPDEIQDDLDDDFDDSLRPNQSTTPPPTRDDKESTSFSSSSKNTRDLGVKSESAWSAKGPSLKATPVPVATNRKDDDVHNKTTAHGAEVHEMDFEKSSLQAVNLTHKSNAVNETNTITTSATAALVTTAKEQTDKKSDKKIRDVKSQAAKERYRASDNKKATQSNNANTSSVVALNDKESSTTTTAVPTSIEKPNQNTKQQRNNKKNAQSAASVSTTTTPSSSAAAAVAQKSSTATASTTTPKRTPVYNQKTQKQTESEKPQTPIVPTAAGQKRNTNAQSDSVYAFDKDDDHRSAAAATPSTKTTYRRQGRNDTSSQPQVDDSAVVAASPPAVTNALSERSPTKKRAAAAAAATAVSLTLSPTENCKLVKVSFDGGQGATKNKSTRASAKKTEVSAPPPAAAITNDADSDADGTTFYIPLQGAGVGGPGDGGIQGVAVKLGREGPDGPNQKVVMQATLVTKAQMDTNSKPLPDSLNTNDLVKTLLNVANAEAAANSSSGKKLITGASTSAAAAAAAAGTNSASNSLKSVPLGNTPLPRYKSNDQTGTSSNAAGGGLVRVNSNSSLFSGSAKSRSAVQAASITIAKKFKDDTPIKMANNTAFPRHDDPTQMVEAPIFRPTEKEFADPIEFIERITPIAARFGICKIIPPATFKPECRISDDMRFTAYNQYVHKMLHRWGPSAKELSAIKKYLATQSIVMNHPPWIGGMEVDLPRLYHTVQELGGLKEVIEKKKWARVAEEMCIPKLAQDRVTKLDDIYCKYLLPYDTLSPAERQKLFDEVEADWAKREARARRNADRFVNTESVSNEEDDVSSDEDDESEEEIDGVSMECIVKGRSMPLSQFFRIARNTMALWFKNADPTVNEVEAEFWRHVAVRDSHVCVHSGSIDSSGWGYGFPSPGPKGKGSNYARHPWNLKVLTNNASSVLRSLGPVMGVTVPTLHVGMLFSACCWYRDPHGLSWIEYLHTGASKLWYGIPDDQSANFRAALTTLIPTHCQNKTIWLPCDTVMVPPHMLTDRGVSLCRIEQKPGEFIVVFPRAYTSSLATGYVVSESVYFATLSWLDLAKDDFRDIHDSCEPAMFSLEQLLFALGYDQRVNSDTLQQMLPMLNDVCEKETAAREQLRAAGVTLSEKVQSEKLGGSKAKKQQPQLKSIESECDLCRANLYISMVRTEDGNVYCLQHALKNLNNGNIQAKQCKLIYAFNVDDIQLLIKSLRDKIQQKRTTASSGAAGGGGKKSK